MAIVQNNETNSYSIILDNNIEYWHEMNTMYEIGVIPANTQIKIHTLNNEIITQTTNTDLRFGFYSYYVSTDQTALNNFFIDSNILATKSATNTNIEGIQLEANKWYGAENTEDGITAHLINKIELQITLTNTLEEINNTLTPYIGNLTEIPADKEPITQLRPFLTEIADAIRTKKGTTDTINAQNFASEIESIEGGGSGGATLKGGEGTAVPVDGETTIENIYVDTSLSVDEVVALIQNNVSLYPTYSADEPAGVVCVAIINNNDIRGVMIMGADGMGIIMSASNETIYFAYDSTGQGRDITDFGLSGWNPDFNGVIEINNYNYYGSLGYSSETGNENLKGLFSITPFIKINVELSGEYTAEILEITENGTTDLINDIVNEKKIVTSIEVNTPVATYTNTNASLSGEYTGKTLSRKNANVVYDMEKSLLENHATLTDLIINSNDWYDVSINNNLVTIPAYCYGGFPRVRSFEAPSVTAIETYAFLNSMIRKIDLQNIETIEDSAFHFSDTFTLILRNEQVCSSKYSSNPTYAGDTPIADGIGYIYVPDELVEDYKNAAGWSRYVNQILPISEIGNWHLVLVIGGDDIGSGIKYSVNDGDFIEITTPQTINLTNVQSITFVPLNEKEVFFMYGSHKFTSQDIEVIYGSKTINLTHDYKVTLYKREKSVITAE